jgi:hypothetical protein
VKIEKINIEKEKFDLNLKFYFFLKYLVKTGLTDNQAKDFLRIIVLNANIDYEATIVKITKYIEEKIKINSPKQKLIFEVIDKINSDTDFKLFVFSLKLYMIKDLLLQEAKIKDLLDISQLETLDPLSLEYDRKTIYSPYSTRINGALLSLIFFDKLENKQTNFISQDAEYFMKSLSTLAIDLKNQGVEPNQIFMLILIMRQLL